MASSRDRSRGLCTSITPAEVGSITGFRVGTPGSVLQGSSTDCTYAAANPSHGVFVRYDTSATASAFATMREAIVRPGNLGTAVSDLGEQAFVYSHTVGRTTTTTETSSNRVSCHCSNTIVEDRPSHYPRKTVSLH